MRQVRAGHAIESEVGACTDLGLFSVSLATAGQEIENEAGICRQGLGSSPRLCFNSVFLSMQIVVTENEDVSAMLYVIP